jgi:cysteine-rich repeat protein
MDTTPLNDPPLRRAPQRIPGIRLTALALTFVAAASAHAVTALDALRYASDVTVVLGGTPVSGSQVVEDDLAGSVAPVSIGVVPAGVSVGAYHVMPGGAQLLSFSNSVSLPGGITAGPQDVVRYDNPGYAVALAGTANGIPAGTMIDAVSLAADGDLLLSFDTTVQLGLVIADDEDIVRLDGSTFTMFFDGSAAGVPPELDVDAADYLATTDRLLLSFDGSGTVGGVGFDDEDVLEYDRQAGTWELQYDGSAFHAAWAPADLTALAALVPVPPSTTTTTTSSTNPPPTVTTTSTTTSSSLPPGTCGNGMVDAGEACDDGNIASCDGCSNLCTIEACGNGVHECAEQCDDGNVASGDGCNASCQLESPPGCGNGIVDAGEGCDDGNAVSCDGCSSFCTTEACGNGTRECAEGCDDGNIASGDGCDASCQLEQPPGCGNAMVDAGEACDASAAVSGCPVNQACRADCTGCDACATLSVADGASAAGGETCLLVSLTSAAPVRAVQATLVDVPDEFELVSVECTQRTAGFSCVGNEVGETNRLNLLLVDFAGRCIPPGSEPIARVCVRDKTPMCGPTPTSVSVTPQDVVVANCDGQTVAPSCTQGGAVLCPADVGDCNTDGRFDLLDVLRKIDIILGRAFPTPAQTVTCDADCDGDIDIFDVVRGIDALLERIPQPLTCAPATAAANIRSLAAGNGAQTTESGTRISLGKRGRVVKLKNPKVPVRGIELTLEPVGGPVSVRGIVGIRRTKNFTVEYHQSGGEGVVKVVIVSLKGDMIRTGRGEIVRLKLVKAPGAGRLRLTGAKVVAEASSNNVQQRDRPSAPRGPE